MKADYRGLLLLLTILLASVAGGLYNPTLYSASAQPPPVTPGIGMSGSFYTLSGLTIPQGGFVNSSDVFIVVYSYYDKPLDVVINWSAPDGITVEFYPNETNFTLKPRESKRLNIIIKASEDVVPGEYHVTVYARAIYKEGPGPVVILPGVAQDIIVEVSGAYGTISAIAVDPGGNIVDTALLRLYMNFRGRLISLVDSYGRLYAKVIPGNYTLRVYLAGDVVGERNITVHDGDKINVTIPIRVIFIEYFSVEPVVASNGKLVAARITLNIKNVYRTITDASIILIVYKDGVLLEKRTLIESSILPEGRSSYTFDYVPSEGWVSGNYTFKVQVYGFGGRLLAESDTRWLYYEAPFEFFNPYLILLIIMIIIMIILIIWRRRRRR